MAFSGKIRLECHRHFEGIRTEKPRQSFFGDNGNTTGVYADCQSYSAIACRFGKRPRACDIRAVAEVMLLEVACGCIHAQYGTASQFDVGCFCIGFTRWQNDVQVCRIHARLRIGVLYREACGRVAISEIPVECCSCRQFPTRDSVGFACVKNNALGRMLY